MVGKEQFRDTDVTRKVAGIRFVPGDSDSIRQAAHIKVLTSRLYENAPGKLIPAHCGPLDVRLGTTSKNALCETCGKSSVDCVGHFGYIDLDFPVFHVGFFKLTIHVLQCICKSCSGLMMKDEQRAYFLIQISNPSLDYSRRKAVHKRIVATCKKTNPCPRCGRRNGLVKKAPGSVLKIAYSHTVTEENAPDYMTATAANSDLSTAIFKTRFTLLNPLRVKKLFDNIPEEDIEIVMARSGEIKHPSDLILTRIPIPPVCVRPSVLSDVKSGTTEDDITMKLSEIILINEVLRKHKEDGAPVKTVTETWDHLQIQVALYFNSELPGLPVELQPKKVISPDPNLRIDEVGIPIHIALTLTFPEVVNNYNIDRMKRLILNGCDTHPGANYVIDRGTGIKRLLKFNECVCTPYNADFDGDEMNLHLPQTYEAKAEANLLMSVKTNLVTPRSGEPLIAAIQV
ncbi:RNA polymerase Rpb1, domain 1 [Ancylostoma ceylanicum]|uniref:DNA-directed RNA polymerase subunit n=1 Tax=Ancylostoma ceylanicum TaxID=53326 RepID=A0A0D6LUY1_9BILA|nr:RNA polymerase Rpb1, domain 1 [Ancylostoma ceylanicum]